jgi:hypothetical protein
MRYDPANAPIPSAWLDADESERLDAILRYHKRAKEHGGNLRAHSAIHTAVENQLAEVHDAAVRAMTRLQAEGLDRHDAVHAIGSVVAKQIHAMLQERREHDSAQYAAQLDALTAESWRNSGDDE